MPIFDNELLGNVSDRSIKQPNIDLRSIILPEVNTHPNVGGFDTYGQVPAKRGLTVEEISQLSRTAKDSNSWDRPPQSISTKELLDNKRYPTYRRGEDLENVYALQQSAWSQFGNGLAKMGITAVGTFGQSFYTLPDTIKAIKNGSLKELSGDPENGGEAIIDQWIKNMEDVFPNYMSKKEKEHPFLAAIPGFAGSANFWGNSIIKNLGFTVGAIGGALTQDAIVAYATGGLGDIPLISAQIGKASLWLNKIFTGSRNLEKILEVGDMVEVGAKNLLTLKRLEQLAAAEKVTNGIRYGLNLYGASRTEAAIEARDGYNQVKEELIKQYKTEHFGQEPTPDALVDINNYAENAMNTRFGINMAILSVSNIIQWDNVLKPFKAAEKGLSSSVSQTIADAGKIKLKKGSIDEFEKQAANTFRERVWESVKPKIANVFSEGIWEEGGQFATERGTYDYYTRKYKNPHNPENVKNWDILNEVINSSSFGLAEQFGTTEGVNNMLVGAISAIITGGAMGQIDKLQGKDKNSRLQASINLLNNYGVTGILENKYADTLDSIGIAKDMESAAKSGDLRKYKNYKHDMFFAYVNSRIPSGMHDVTLSQLNMLKELDQDQFEKMFNIDFNTANKKTVAEYVDRLIQKANKIKETSDALNTTFKNPFTFHKNPIEDNDYVDNVNYQTFNYWKTDLAYYSTIPFDRNERLGEIEKSLFKINPLLNNDLISSLSNEKSLRELSEFYEEKANSLNKGILETTPLIERRKTQEQIKKLRTVSEKINLALNNNTYGLEDFNTLLNYELNNQDSSKDSIISSEYSDSLYTYGIDINQIRNDKKVASEKLANLITKEGFEKYFDEAEKIRKNTLTSEEEDRAKRGVLFDNEGIAIFKNNNGVLEELEIGRTYAIPKLRKATVRKISDDRYQVIDGAGNRTFYSTRERAKEAAEEIIADTNELISVKLLAINKDGSIKIEDLSGNIINIDPKRLKGYTRTETEQEKLIRNSSNIEQEQTSLETKSGTITINSNTEKTIVEDEGALKAAHILFTSSTSASEKWEPESNNIPHIRRSRIFLNNVDTFENRADICAILVTPKQIEHIGLSGLVQMSYKLDPSTPLSDIKNVNDPREGFVAQVFVIQENGETFFVDQDGNKIIGNENILDKVIFQTMPKADVYALYMDGVDQKKPKFRSHEKELAEAYLIAYVNFRNDLFNKPKEEISINEFVVSRGIAKEIIINGKREKNHVGGILVPENKISTEEGLIYIPTTGVVAHNGEAIKFPAGTPVLRYGSTVQFLNNKLFSETEAKTIFHVINNYAKGLIEQSKTSSNIRLQNDYSTFLQNILYWRKENTTSNNQIFIDAANMNIHIGTNKYPMTEISAYEKEIIENLQKAFNAVNNTTLLNSFHEPFYEYKLNTNNTVNEDDYIEWENYQTYLLSKTFPDGKIRPASSTPLSTSVAAPTDFVPYSYEQKYSILNNMGLSIQSPITKPAAVQSTPTQPKLSTQKIGEYDMSGNTINTYFNSKNEPVLFIGEINEDGSLYIEIQDNETITKAIENSATVEYAKNILINGQILVDGKINGVEPTNEEIIKIFVSGIINRDLLKLREEEKAAAKNNITTPEKPPVDPISTDPNRFNDAPELPDYRKVNSFEVDRMNEEDIEIFKKWAAKNFPNVPYEILTNIINTIDGEKAWGVFENGIIKFVKGGMRGTEYHEVMEAIWKAVLTEEEKDSLIEEFRLRDGSFIDRVTGKKINYLTARENEIKEKISDEFAEYRLGKLPARSLGEWLKKFFNRIMEFFKSITKKTSLKDDLFKAINIGKFRDRKVYKTGIDTTPEYSKISGLTANQTREFVDDMTARAAGILYKEGQKKLLFSPERITSKEMFEKIEQQYSIPGKDGFSYMDKLGTKAWVALKQKTILSLRTLGVNFDDEDLVTINEEEISSVNYAPEPFSTDWKKTSSGAIKFSLATLLVTQKNSNNARVSLTLPAPKTSSIGGFKLLNFSKAFATVLDTLSNTSSISIMIDKMADLAIKDSDYVRLWQRLGGKLIGGQVVKEIDFSSFDLYDWRYFIQFTQTFTKQKPEGLIQYISSGEVYTSPANLFTAAKLKQEEWLENIKTLALDPSSYIFYNKASKTFQVDVQKLEALSIKTTKEQIAFLNTIGIDFTEQIYNKLKTKGTNRRTSEQNIFITEVSNLKKYLASNNNILSISNKTLGVNSQLSKLSELYVTVTNPNQESTHFGVENERRGSFSENNVSSVFENVFNEADSIEELLLVRPELNDIFSKGSQVLKPGGLFFNKDGKRIKNIKVSYIEGTKIVEDGKGIATSNLTKGKRLTQEINQNLDGNYYILIPADGSTEWMMNMGNNITFADIEGTRGISKINTIFIDYLLDDINLALDFENREYIKNIKGKGLQLRFFQDILFPKELKDINNLLAKKSDISIFKKYIEDNKVNITKAIQSYIQEMVEETKNLLIKNSEIQRSKEDVWSYPELSETLNNKTYDINKWNLSETTLLNILKYVNTNYIINNIEYHKILFGDPFQFAIKDDGSLDEIKRLKSFLSPRRTTFDTPEFNAKLNDVYNTVSGVKLSKKDPGYHLYKDHINTVTFTDNIIAGSLANTIEAYAKTDVTDGFSWLMDNTYKEINLKNGQWSDEAEAWHQWQMAYTRQKMPGYVYNSLSLEKHDKELISTPMPYHTIEVKKPIVTGNKLNSNKFDIVLDKFAQMPVYFSMVEGTTMEKFYIKMFKENIGYGIVEAGRKVGVEEVHNLYNKNGKFNNDIFNNIIKIPWKIYGIQVETATDGKHVQTRGSQLTKMASMDLFENGVPVNSKVEEEYNRNVFLLDKMHENAYKTLMKKIGVIDTGDGFILENGKAISTTLVAEMGRRVLSENTLDAIQLNEENKFNIPFEASPAYLKIRDILYSLIDKALISPKMNGAPHVQVPSLMFEEATKNRSLAVKKDNMWVNITKEEYDSYTEEQKKGVLLTDKTLKFYTEEHPYCEILIPHWFKGKLGKHKDKTDEELIQYLNTPEGRLILSGIGFRIPSQALSSIEIFRIKGFLPSYMGSTVVVPAEITTKAGSDFDIDKLNMYLKSIYVDRTGDIKLIKLVNDDETDTKNFFRKVYEDTLEVKQAKKMELIEAVDILVYGLEDSKKLLNKYKNYLLEMQEEYENPFDFRDKLVEQLEKLSDENYQEVLKEEYVDKMYKGALENEYYSSLERLLTIGDESFKKLITPIDDAGLKSFSEKMDILKNYNEENVKNKILNRNYMSSRRHSFLLGKRWIGIAAVSITSLSLKQKSQVYIDPFKFVTLSKTDSDFLGDGKINMPHNSVRIGDKSYISLSGRKVKNSQEFISNRYSGYATSFVDVAKDDYITKLIYSDLLIGVYMFLENIGMGENAALFLNQPIIEEYVNALEQRGRKSLFDKQVLKRFELYLSPDSSFYSKQETIFDYTNLEKNIKDYNYGKKDIIDDIENYTEQGEILREFLKYAKMAEFNFKFSQAINYDTSKFRSAEALIRKQLKTQEAENINIITSANNILNTTFLKNQVKYLQLSTQALSTVLKLDQPEFLSLTNSILKPYALNTYINADKFDKIAMQTKAGLLDYIIQTKSNYNSQIYDLLVNTETALVYELEKLKETYPQLDILQNLQATSGIRINGAKTIKLNANIKEAYDEDLYTAMMRELRDYNKETNQFFKKLVILSIFQGVYSSAVSIRNIIPLESYSEIVEPIMSTLRIDPSFDSFVNGAFLKNNFKSDDIVPYFTNLRFKEIEMPPEPEYNQYGDYMGEKYSYETFVFQSVPGLNVNKNDRRILFIDEQYNSSALQYDLLKVSRVQTSEWGDKFDITTGKSILLYDFVVRKALGDESLKDIYGYTKVKKIDGSPLIINVFDGRNMTRNYVYKLTNLWGDGIRAKENYEWNIPSVIDNGTIKIENEIPDADIVEVYGEHLAPSLKINEIKSSALSENINNLLSLPSENLEREIAELEQKIYELKELESITQDVTIESIVANSLPKITPASAKKETGLKTGNTKDIATSLLSTKGVTIDKAAHDIWENNQQFDIQEIKDIIIDILNSKSLKEYKDNINKTSKLKDLVNQLKYKKQQLNNPENKPPGLPGINRSPEQC